MADSMKRHILSCALQSWFNLLYAQTKGCMAEAECKQHPAVVLYVADETSVPEEWGESFGDMTQGWNLPLTPSWINWNPVIFPRQHSDGHRSPRYSHQKVVKWRFWHWTMRLFNWSYRGKKLQSIISASLISSQRDSSPAWMSY